MLLITCYEIQLFAIIQIKTLQMVSLSVECPFDPRNGGESWFVQRDNTSDCRVFLSWFIHRSVGANFIPRGSRCRNAPNWVDTIIYIGYEQNMFTINCAGSVWNDSSFV